MELNKPKERSLDYITIRNQLKELTDKTLPGALRDLIPLEKDKAISKGTYEKVLAQTMLRASKGVRIMIENELVENVTATNLEKICKGVVFQESINLDLAESALKRQYVLIGSIRDKISALQSLLRYEE